MEEDSCVGVSLSTSSSMEGELTLSCELGEEEGCTVSTLPGCEQALAGMGVEQVVDHLKSSVNCNKSVSSGES